VRSIANRFINPHCHLNPLTNNLDSYVVPVMYFSQEFEDLVKDSNEKDVLNSRCLQFLKVLLKQRLPKNIHILEKVSLISVKNALHVIKDPLSPLTELFMYEKSAVDKVNQQCKNITNIKWLETSNTTKFWKEVSEYRDASDINPVSELCDHSRGILVLPWSNADF